MICNLGVVGSNPTRGSRIDARLVLSLASIRFLRKDGREEVLRQFVFSERMGARKSCVNSFSAKGWAQGSLASIRFLAKGWAPKTFA